MLFMDTLPGLPIAAFVALMRDCGTDAIATPTTR